MFFSPGAIAVWQRNFLYFRQSWLVSCFWIILEPSLYLGAIGFGLGRFIDSIDGMSYIDFYYPALLATTAMMVPFFEATYGSYTKFKQQKTFATMMLSPIEPEEIVQGEILWAATKGFWGVLGVVVIGQILGLNYSWGLLPALIVVALTCWLFASLGMLATSLARNYDSFIYTTSGFIIPMSLFSGTYFSLKDFPDWLHRVAYVLPLTHAVTLIRGLMRESVNYWMLLNLLVVILVALMLTKTATSRIKKQLL